MSTKKNKPRGFTLVEILIVIGIVLILVALTIPLLSGIGESKQVSSEADNVSSQISYAQLLAKSSNRPVELRFYLKPVTETQTKEYVRASQVMVTDADGLFQPDGRIRDLAGKVIIHPSPEFSSITGGQPLSPDPNAQSQNNKVAQDLEYHAIRFMPNGSTNLGKSGTNQHWTLTFINWSPVINESELPSDFVTIQVDPFTSQLRRYEPGQ